MTDHAHSEPVSCRVVVGDARSLEAIATRSVQLIVTSPPYGTIKDYEHPAQIGSGQTYEDYVNSMNLVWEECYRVLEPGGKLCINIGDQFIRATATQPFRVAAIHAEILKFCDAIGFDLKAQIIWRKVTTTKSSGGARNPGSFPYPRSGLVKQNHEYILVLARPGTAGRPTPANKEASRLSLEEWNAWHKSDWAFPGIRQDGHVAMFPPELPMRLIRMFSFVGDTVLDPFLGSGTTAAEAIRLGRNAIGVELNRDFLPLVRERIAGVAGNLEPTVEYGRGLDHEALARRVAAWPYRFVEPARRDAERSDEQP